MMFKSYMHRKATPAEWQKAYPTAAQRLAAIEADIDCCKNKCLDGTVGTLSCGLPKAQPAASSAFPSGPSCPCEVWRML